MLEFILKVINPLNEDLLKKKLVYFLSSGLGAPKRFLGSLIILILKQPIPASQGYSISKSSNKSRICAADPKDKPSLLFLVDTLLIEEGNMLCETDEE